jgi:hypothetical protein
MGVADLRTEAVGSLVARTGVAHRDPGGARQPLGLIFGRPDPPLSRAKTFSRLLRDRFFPRLWRSMSVPAFSSNGIKYYVVGE